MGWLPLYKPGQPVLWSRPIRASLLRAVGLHLNCGQLDEGSYLNLSAPTKQFTKVETQDKVHCMQSSRAAIKFYDHDHDHDFFLVVTCHLPTQFWEAVSKKHAKKKN